MENSDLTQTRNKIATLESTIQELLAKVTALETKLAEHEAKTVGAHGIKLSL
jgi:BMFP domain-containing protein YqiC